MPPVGPTELILILAIVVLIFGAGRLAEVGGALGRSVREFRRATDGDDATSASGAPNTLDTCRRCGVVLHSRARFCGSCGTVVAPEDLERSPVPPGTERPAVGGRQ
jgi:sec-independent protein translocase protein TatA